MSEKVYVADGYSLRRVTNTLVPNIALEGWKTEQYFLASKLNDPLLYGFFDEILQEHEE